MDVIEIKQPEFGQRLRQRRLERGLSQKELAGNLMTSSYVSLIEHGRRVPTLDVVVLLARLLNTTLHDLVGDDVEGLMPPAAPVVLNAQMEARHLTEAGDLDGARETLAGRLTALRQKGSDELMLEVGLDLLAVLLAAGAHGDRLVLLDELSALPLVSRSPAVRLSLLVDRASALREVGRLADARDVAKEATGLLEKLDGPATAERVRVLGVLVSVLSEFGELEPAEAGVNEMISAAAEVGQVGVRGRAHWVASMAYNRMGRSDEACEHLERAREELMYENMPVRDWLRFCRFTAAILLDTSRDPEAARAWIETAEVTATMTGLTAETNATMRERARYELAIGNSQTAAELYTRLLDESSVGSDRLVAELGLGEALERSGRPDQAIEWLRRAAEHYEESGNYRKATETWRRIDQLRQVAAERPAGTRATPWRASTR